MEPIVFDARYRTWLALARDHFQQIKLGGMLLRTDEAELPQFSPMTVRITLPSGEVFHLAGQVLQLVPGQGVAVQFGSEASADIARLEELCLSKPPASGESAPEDDPRITLQKTKTPAAGARIQLATEPQELRRQLDAMTVNQKRQAALHGRREARMILIKDRNKMVHPFVIKNPAISLDEIEQFSKMPTVNPDCLRMMANNRDWTRVTSICRNLVRNPKTPMKEALLLLAKLPMSDIRAMAKSGNVRTPIQQACRKKINQ